MSIESNIRAYAKRCAERQPEPKPAQGHTPGPWEPTEPTMVAVVSETKQVRVCTLNQELHRLEREANARLIAAAPDLLAALKVLLPYIEACVEEPTDAASSDLGQLRAAIAKAEGH